MVLAMDKTAFLTIKHQLKKIKHSKVVCITGDDAANNKL